MDHAPQQPVKDPPNLIRIGLFSLDRLLTHIDPGTAKESEDFVSRIYEQRYIDLSPGHDGKLVVHTNVAAIRVERGILAAPCKMRDHADEGAEVIRLLEERLKEMRSKGAMGNCVSPISPAASSFRETKGGNCARYAERYTQESGSK